MTETGRESGTPLDSVCDWYDALPPSTQNVAGLFPQDPPRDTKNSTIHPKKWTRNFYVCF